MAVLTSLTHCCWCWGWTSRSPTSVTRDCVVLAAFCGVSATDDILVGTIRKCKPLQRYDWIYENCVTAKIAVCTLISQLEKALKWLQAIKKKQSERRARKGQWESGGKKTDIPVALFWFPSVAYENHLVRRYTYTGLTSSLETMSMPMGRPEPDVLLKHNKRYDNNTKGYNDGYIKPTLTSSIFSVVATLFWFPFLSAYPWLSTPTFSSRMSFRRLPLQKIKKKPMHWSLWCKESKCFIFQTKKKDIWDRKT